MMTLEALKLALSILYIKIDMAIYQTKHCKKYSQKRWQFRYVFFDI